MTMNCLPAMAAGASGPFTLSYVGTANQVSSASSYTFVAAGIGNNPQAGRRVFVAVMVSSVGAAASSISSITIGGVATTVHAQTTTPAGLCVGIASLVVESGTTANVVVTLNQAMEFAAVFVWEMLNPQNSAPTDTVTDNTLTDTGSTEIVSGQIDTAADGAMIAIASNIAGGAVTWTGITVNQTVNVDGFARTSAASQVGYPSQVNATVQASFVSEFAVDSVLAAVSWR